MSQSSILAVLLLCSFSLLSFVPSNNALTQALITDVMKTMFPDKPPPPPAPSKQPLLDQIDESTQKLLPSVVKQVLSQVSPDDLDGLKEVAKDVMDGKINSVEDLKKSFKEHSPGMVAAFNNLHMQAKWKVIQIIMKLQPKSKEFLKSAGNVVKDGAKKISDMFVAQPANVKSDLAENIKQSLPPTKPILENPDVKSALTLP